jgi:hypothetical protein
MATRYLPKQGMARNGAKSTSPGVSPYVFEPQGVAIPNTLSGIAAILVRVVQIGPSSPRN